MYVVPISEPAPKSPTDPVGILYRSLFLKRFLLFPLLSSRYSGLVSDVIIQVLHLLSRQGLLSAPAGAKREFDETETDNVRTSLCHLQSRYSNNWISSNSRQQRSRVSKRRRHPTTELSRQSPRVPSYVNGFFISDLEVNIWASGPSNYFRG